MISNCFVGYVLIEIRSVIYYTLSQITDRFKFVWQRKQRVNRSLDVNGFKMQCGNMLAEQETIPEIANDMSSYFK